MALHEFGERFSSPTQNFIRCQQGRRDLEKLVKAILLGFFDLVLILPLHVRHM